MSPKGHSFTISSPARVQGRSNYACCILSYKKMGEKKIQQPDFRLFSPGSSTGRAERAPAISPYTLLVCKRLSWLPAQ